MPKYTQMQSPMHCVLFLAQLLEAERMRDGRFSQPSRSFWQVLDRQMAHLG